ncbi:acylphosphatase [Candidatus Oleimmundimicrobium sp.]|uniref:acylphosphatase n=1 Tax=Candidatus Oleimmundimicrobium sp. TaxID=3060597 RepID=UPI00271D3C7D|nr:acylphosphatase [Candidatus Oleimmundimicrobium sp.]MDO8885422.1 acylphosphatase [Candidatus Oleimmundimicrobium sp.]
MAKVCVYVKVTGKVQGVYFRSYTKEIAENNKVIGWVKNASDGSVKMILEGEEKDVKKVIDLVYQGPPSAKVTNVKVKKEGYKGEFEEFQVRY